MASRAGIVRMRENLIKYFNSWYESIVEDSAEDMLMFTFTLLVQPRIAFSCKQP